jgi:hypothetical protein
MQELLLLFLIVLVLWPKPILVAAKWVCRQALGGGSPKVDSPGEVDKPDGAT